MSRLIDHQLAFERLVEDVDTYPEPFKSGSRARDFFVSLESYLQSIVTEYENSRRTMSPASDTHLSSLKELARFLNRDDFKESFADEFYALIGDLRMECQHRT
jgi:hypothetical protein